MSAANTRRIAVLAHNAHLRRAIRRLLERALDDIEIIDAGLDPAAALADGPPVYVLIVDTRDMRASETLRHFARLVVRPFILALTEEKPGSTADALPADAFLVKFSPNAAEDLGANLVTKVREALGRVFASVDAALNVRLGEAERAWVETLAGESQEGVGEPPAGLRDALLAPLPERPRALLESQGRARCLAFGERQELPWEWLLPPTSMLPDARQFIAARLYSCHPPPRSAGTGGPFRAVHAVFPPLEARQSQPPGGHYSGIRGELGLAALKRLSSSVGGACEPVRGPKTIERIAAACAGGADLLHLACHARIQDGSGELSLAKNEFGDADWVPAREIAQLLSATPPRVVVLEACCSGLGPRGVAAELLRVGVAAVVCFQMRPSQELAARVVERFYAGLEATWALDAAVWATRRVSEGSPVAWGGLVIAVSAKEGLDVLAHHRRPSR